MVITEGLHVDYPATLSQRRTMTKRPSTDFEYGIGRINYEKAIPGDFRTMVIELLAAAPPASRLYGRGTPLLRTITESGFAASLDVEGVKRIMAEVMTPPAPTFVVSAPETHGACCFPGKLRKCFPDSSRCEFYTQDWFALGKAISVFLSKRKIACEQFTLVDQHSLFHDAQK